MYELLGKMNMRDGTPSLSIATLSVKHLWLEFFLINIHFQLFDFRSQISFLFVFINIWSYEPMFDFGNYTGINFKIYLYGCWHFSH